MKSVKSVPEIAKMETQMTEKLQLVSGLVSVCIKITSREIEFNFLVEEREREREKRGSDLSVFHGN